MTNQTEKLERWINAYLDGALDPIDAARFESVVDRNPSLRERLDTHRLIEASLNRTFAPPVRKPAAPSSIVRETISMEAAEPAGEAAPPSARTSGRFFRKFAMAAMLAIVAFGGYWGWQNRALFIGTSGPLTLTQFYEKSAANDFKEDWVCKNERQFQTTFWYRLGSGVALASAPSNVKVLGIKYGNTLSPQSVHLTAKVDGKGVVVFVDSKHNDRKDDVSSDGLHAFRKETDHLVFVEVSPLDHPAVLGLLSETELPVEWTQELDIPMANQN
ncbi:MAG: hypothetical protein H6818_08540 [Phycisphaerales bacterium]|nr:hypothetical protein [Phycisphaerales bacterium]MCB9862618.1 hypothetical protein [Phycisphaerales bacterium]